jgi:uncharacterized repeat protein (TIGR01451 family)
MKTHAKGYVRLLFVLLVGLLLAAVPVAAHRLAAPLFQSTNIDLVKEVSDLKVEPGDMLTYTLYVANNDASQATTRTVVIDYLPSGTVMFTQPNVDYYIGYQGGIDGSITYSPTINAVLWGYGYPADGSIAANDVVTIWYQVQVVATSGYITNDAEISTYPVLLPWRSNVVTSQVFSGQDFLYTKEAAVPIPENSCANPISSTINVPDGFVISSVNVGFNASHDYRGEISATLMSPDGTRVHLIDHSTDGWDNFDLLLEDGGDPIIVTGDDDVTTPYYDRSAAPTSTLSTFNGKNAYGTWRLYFCEEYQAQAGASGTLNQWSLFFNAEKPEGAVECGDAPDTRNHGSGTPTGAMMRAYTLAPPLGKQGNYPSIWDPTLPLGPEGHGFCHYSSTLYLGSGLSVEADADQTYDGDGVTNLNPAADTADADGFDDGVAFNGKWRHCQPISLTVTTSSPGFINVWFDWARDGDWNEADMSVQCGCPANEWPVQNYYAPASGVYTLTTDWSGNPIYACETTLSAGNPLGSDIWLRVTLTPESDGTLSGLSDPYHSVGGQSTGTCFSGGETEDYYITFGPNSVGLTDVTAGPFVLPAALALILVTALLVVLRWRRAS